MTPMTYKVMTLGCKVNQYEAQQIKQFLQNRHAAEAKNNHAPDLAVIHSCQVTAEAAKQSRQTIRKVRRRWPNAQVIVTGCLADDNSLDAIEGLAGRFAHKSPILDRLSTLTDNIIAAKNLGQPHIKTNYSPQVKQESRPTHAPAMTELPMITRFENRRRAFLKIQDGCNAGCRYCIVCRKRPRLWSKPPEQVLEEADALCRAQHKEIVLTGIYLGAYGRNTAIRKYWPPAPDDTPLARLIRKLINVPGLKRLRLSSLEPPDADEALLQCFREHTMICPHLHLPVQSGSDRILQLMGRQYAVSDVLAAVQRANRLLDRPAITTDIMVGYPSETEEDFLQTLDLCRRVGFSRIHVFPYSPRPGTPAARMSNQIPSPIRRQRAARMRSEANLLRKKFIEQFIGQTLHVLVESYDPKKGTPFGGGICTGHTPRYIELSFPARSNLINRIVPIHPRRGVSFH